MEGGYLDHNPAWRTYKYAGQKKEKKIADDETVKKLIQALESVSILYETYFKLIIATGMRRGECCALKWEDINYAERSIHVCRNAVKTTGDEIIVKAPKTKAGNRYVYFSAEMESLLREYEAFCEAESLRKAHGVCRPGRDKLSAKRKVSKGFNFVSANFWFGCADSRFAKPRSFPVRETDCHFLRRAKSNQKARSDVQKVAGGKFLCVGDRRNRENCERT